MLKISFDIGGVISKYPELFRKVITVMKSGGAEVFVLTDMADREKTLSLLKTNGIILDDAHVLTADYGAEGEACKDILIQEHQIDIHVDDFPAYCANTSCVNLFVWPNPDLPYFSDSFVTDGQEGKFGRQRPSKVRNI